MEGVVSIPAILPLFAPVLVLPLLLACTNAQPLSSMSQTPKPSLPTSLHATLRVIATTARAEVDFQLSDQRWQHRLVLFFAPSE